MNTTSCPNCGEQHKIIYGKNMDGNESTLVAYVHCTSNDTSYLAHIDRKPIDKSTTVFVDDDFEFFNSNPTPTQIRDYMTRVRNECYSQGKAYRDAIECSIPQSMIDQQVVLAESEAYKKGYIDGSLESREEERAFILNVLDGIDIADGECNTKAIRKMLEARVV